MLKAQTGFENLTESPFFNENSTFKTILDSNSFWLFGPNSFENNIGPHYFSINSGEEIKNPSFIQDTRRFQYMVFQSIDSVYYKKNADRGLYLSTDTGKTFNLVTVGNDSIYGVVLTKNRLFYRSLENIEKTYILDRAGKLLDTSKLFSRYKYALRTENLSYRNSYVRGDTLLFYFCNQWTDSTLMERSFDGGKTIELINTSLTSCTYIKHLSAKLSYAFSPFDHNIYWCSKINGEFDNITEIRAEGITDLKELHMFSKNEGLALDYNDRLYKKEKHDSIWRFVHEFKSDVYNLHVINKRIFFVSGPYSLYKTSNWGSKLQIDEISISDNKLQAYPSDKNQILFIGEWQKQMEVNIYDLNGRVLLSKSLTKNEVLSHTLPSGVYLIQGIQNGERVLAQKIVIQ
ncbi:MAG: T9SS type A sorting domain-containing protein [Bacteroidia bacterium]